MQVNNLCYQHQRNAPLFFHNLCFNLEKGKIHALHGKNGMGKTVLLNILSKNISPQSILQGQIQKKEKVILVNQKFDQMIVDQFSFKDNLRFASMGLFPSVFSGLKDPAFLPDFITKFHLDINKPVKELSGGQRQILALLMVLQKEKGILLLDEPTAALDESNARIVFDFLRTLGMTILVVCHDRELVEGYVDGSHFHLEMDGSGVRRLVEICGC